MKIEMQDPARGPHADASLMPAWGRETCGIDTMEPPLLHFALVDAHWDPETAALCYEKKLTCYARFGIAAASVPIAENIGDGLLHLVTATDPASGEIVGGVSIYRRGPSCRLPVELALGGEESMASEIATWRGRNVVELSGLWTEDAWRKTGLSEQLMLVAFAATHVLKAEMIIGFGHHHVLDFYATVGLAPDLSFGQFVYPNARYVATVVRGDPVRFSTLPPRHRQTVATFAHALANRQVVTWATAARRSQLPP